MSFKEDNSNDNILFKNGKNAINNINRLNRDNARNNNHNNNILNSIRNNNTTSIKKKLSQSATQSIFKLEMNNINSNNNNNDNNDVKASRKQNFDFDSVTLMLTYEPRYQMCVTYIVSRLTCQFR